MKFLGTMNGTGFAEHYIYADGFVSTELYWDRGEFFESEDKALKAAKKELGTWLEQPDLKRYPKNYAGVISDV